MKSRQENETVEEQNVAIIDYSVAPTETLSHLHTKLSRGWFDQYERSKYRLENERKKDSLHFQARKI
jgi:hypothetical protein